MGGGNSVPEEPTQNLAVNEQNQTICPACPVCPVCKYSDDDIKRLNYEIDQRDNEIGMLNAEIINLKNEYKSMYKQSNDNMQSNNKQANEAVQSNDKQSNEARQYVVQDEGDISYKKVEEFVDTKADGGSRGLGGSNPLGDFSKYRNKWFILPFLLCFFR